MTLLFETVRRWRLPLVCCAWMFCLIVLLLRGGYATFLADGFAPILALAVLALLPMAVFALLRREVPSIGLREALATAILLLPLAYIARAGGATLGAGALNARYVGSGVVYSGTETKHDRTTLLTLFSKAEQYNGREIAVVGMVAQDNPYVVELLGRSRPLLFRFVINCCAADATPLALVMEGEGMDGLLNDSWVEATGTFRIRRIGDQDMLILENARAAAIRPPAEPYLYVPWL